ncbi:RagB/SusD family nutrient uptake outer membrane protein [Dyadobacter fanqingshengii]|uniref:RagB/SusD family nutrient uptake outer membrane protein n=1 Tax=Dyadobacter fanqingshengii TaxID=2906443 RepID=A0A9X1TFZ5_9BACT|nr:RagB/SusD family nutrient uptake outer membrane protein [Dyadobacter fanqingshengii]MCF0039997.1 RagB/SusD family nutrient uptake outer membrane protein [Dyadobacter fanqingshengii]USJ38249.1 RagB/SusD family nutrient uptake outer membrane protein [Dyadobacter fanqingshengii]
MKKKFSLIFAVAGLLFMAPGCTDLEEQVLDETLKANLSPDEAANGLLAPVYALLPNLFQHTTYFALNEITTDEAILPYRGGTDWGDNGIYLALHQHNTTATDPNVNNTWGTLSQSISRSITAINGLKTSSSATAALYAAEARGMRAYYNMIMLDMFGVVFVKDDPNAASVIIRGEEALKYIESELLAIEPIVQSKSVVGPGRLNQVAVWGLLARLNLNAAVYRNVYAPTFEFRAEDMDKVIQYTDKIIASGQAKLSPDYFSIFGNQNHSNQELIFAVDQRADLNGHNRLAYFSISGDQFPLAAFPAANGTDGPGITSDFYQSWVQAYGAVDPKRDPRFYQENMSVYSNAADTCVKDSDYKINRGILRGQQFGALRVNGAFVRCPDGRLKVGKLSYVTRNRADLPVSFGELVDFTTAGSNYNTGYRVAKYEFGSESNTGRNKGDADIVILRLADIYMMRAEAKLRKSNDAAGALADVNFVRASRTATTPPPALTAMNLDLLFRERGFEFYWEMLRRSDMIRFGKYEGKWTEKSNADVKKRIFPIPQTAIDGASNVPGYLKQNDGY